MTVKRVRLSPNVFKISAAGADVDSAADADLIFNGFSTDKHHGVYMRSVFSSAGANDWTWGPWQLGDASLTLTKQISLGKTFSAAPDFMAICRLPAFTGGVTLGGVTYYPSLPQWSFTDAGGHTHFPYAYTTTTDLYLAVYIIRGGGINPPTITWFARDFAYVVFQRG